MLEHIHLEDEFVQHQPLIGWLDYLFIHSRSITVHLPVEAQCSSTSMGLHRTAFLSVLKVYGHWIMLWLCPSHGRSLSLGVNGGMSWPGRWASAWWLEGLRKTELPLTEILNYRTSMEHSLVLSPIADFASESKDKLSGGFNRGIGRRPLGAPIVGGPQPTSK